MRRAIAVFACASLGWGCNQVFGLDETSQMPVAKLSLNSLWIEAEASPALIDMSASKVTFDLIDPDAPGQVRSVEPTTTTPNTWELEVGSELETHLRFVVPGDPVVRYSSLPYRELSATTYHLGRRDEDPAVPTATVSVSITTPPGQPFVATDAIGFLALGAWAAYSFPAPPGQGATAYNPTAVPMSATTALGARGSAKILPTDPVVVTRRDATGALVGTLTAMPTVSATNTTISGALTPVTADQTYQLSVDVSSATSRLAALRPAFAAPSMNLTLRAAPGGAYGVAEGVPLATRAVPAGTTGMFSFAGSYGNPFLSRGWPTAATWSAIAMRSYGAVPLEAGLTWVGTAIADGSTVSTPTCLPTETRIQNLLLDADGRSINIDRGARVQITAVPDTTGAAAAQLYRLEIREILADRPVPVARAVAFAASPSWALPPDLFKVGSIYTLRIGCQTGFPRLSEGDIGTRQLPIITGYADSPVFTVAQ